MDAQLHGVVYCITCKRRLTAVFVLWVLESANATKAAIYHQRGRKPDDAHGSFCQAVINPKMFFTV